MQVSIKRAVDERLWENQKDDQRPQVTRRKQEVLDGIKHLIPGQSVEGHQSHGSRWRPLFAGRHWLHLPIFLFLVRNNYSSFCLWWTTRCRLLVHLSTTKILLIRPVYLSAFFVLWDSQRKKRLLWSWDTFTDRRPFWCDLIRRCKISAVRSVWIRTRKMRKKFQLAWH